MARVHPVHRYRWRRGLRSAVMVAVGVVVAGGALVAVPSAATAEAAPTAAFDYSMPKRFGQDQNGDGKIDYFTGTSDSPVIIGGVEKKITPDSWHVDLNACASTAGSTFAWVVVDQPDQTHPLVVQGGPACDAYYFEVPEEGTYRVTLKATKDGVDSAPVTRPVIVQDWLIVSVGDSYGSGEGVPDIPISDAVLTQAQQKWDDAGAAWNEVTTIRASYAGLDAAIAVYNQHVAEASHACNPDDPLADAVLCATLGVYIAGDAATVVGEAIALGLNIAAETVADVITAMGASIDAAVAAAQVAVQVAEAATGQLKAQWQSRRCHRSANAGSARAAKMLEDADPHTSVTFVHLSCSGASVVYGLLGLYQGAENDGVENAHCNDSPANAAKCIPAQIAKAKELIGNREVDAVYVSIGGNDAHFADLIAACIMQNYCQDPNNWVANTRDHVKNEFCNLFGSLPWHDVLLAKCNDFADQIPDFAKSAAELWEEGKYGQNPLVDAMFQGHEALYRQLDQAVVQQSAGATGGWLLPYGRSDRLFLSQYVDAVKADDGRLCDWATDGFKTLPFLSGSEAGWVANTVSPELTGDIQAAVAAHNWTYVGGIYDGFTNHGYCANDHYLVRIEESFVRQGNYSGMVHPNNSGHSVYGNQIYAAWLPKLYPNGLSGQPRRPDQKPFADAGGPYSLVEGQTATMTNTTSDSDGDAMTYAWSTSAPQRVSFSGATAAAPTLTAIDNGSGTVSVTVTDADGDRTDSASFTVANAPPVITSTGLPVEPVPIGTAISAKGTFTDAGVNDKHTGGWDWGDGTTPTQGTVTESAGSGTISGSHTYTAPGIYTAKFMVSDGDDAVEQPFEYVVVFDPSGGFTTGGGWIDSPPGAYTPADATDADVTGRAIFAFVSKYQKGATVPTGTTSFKFQSAGLDFDSAAYQWLVISGAKAQYKGSGTVNGQPGYGFLLSVVDGDATATPTTDKFRMKIWSVATGTVLYDNQAGSSDDAVASTAIGAGEIRVHSGK